jgi:glycosyltransferase involved in cell wall biosynthesis
VLKGCPSAELVVTGRWVPTTPPRVGELLIKMPGVIREGMVSPSELEALLWSSSVWVYPCTFFECYPVAAADAMVAGCHIVTSPLAGLWEIVEGTPGTMIAGNVNSQAVRQKYADAIVEKLRASARPDYGPHPCVDWTQSAAQFEAEIRCLYGNFDPTPPDVAVVMISKDPPEKVQRAINSAAPWCKGAVVVVDEGDAEKYD